MVGSDWRLGAVGAMGTVHTALFKLFELHGCFRRPTVCGGNPGHFLTDSHGHFASNRAAWSERRSARRGCAGAILRGRRGGMFHDDYSLSRKGGGCGLYPVIIGEGCGSLKRARSAMTGARYRRHRIREKASCCVGDSTVRTPRSFCGDCFLRGAPALQANGP